MIDSNKSVFCFSSPTQLSKSQLLFKRQGVNPPVEVPLGLNPRLSTMCTTSNMSTSFTTKQLTISAKIMMIDINWMNKIATLQLVNKFTNKRKCVLTSTSRELAAARLPHCNPRTRGLLGGSLIILESWYQAHTFFYLDWFFLLCTSET